VVDYATEDCFQEDQQTREDPREMTSARSAISVIPTTRKISIRKAKKIQRRRSIIPNPKLRSVFRFQEMMESEFQMSMMGELTFFLGIQVKQTKQGTFVH
jgi:hypothetical protein